MKRYKVIITVAGDHGEVMRMERNLPLAVLTRAKQLFAEIDEWNKVHDMTLAKRKLIDICRTLGRSDTWVKQRQKDMELK